MCNPILSIVFSWNTATILLNFITTVNVMDKFYFPQRIKIASHFSSYFEVKVVHRLLEHQFYIFFSFAILSENKIPGQQKIMDNNFIDVNVINFWTVDYTTSESRKFQKENKSMWRRPWSDSSVLLQTPHANRRLLHVSSIFTLNRNKDLRTIIAILETAFWFPL